MGIRDFLDKINPFTPRSTKRSGGNSRSYSGAIRNRLNSDWQTSNTSADAELRGSLSLLRSRSRDLIRNNDYAKSAIRTLKNNVIGATGINFQSQIRLGSGDLDEKNNNLIESQWQTWSSSKICDITQKLNWTQLQHLLLKSVAESGEALARKYRTGEGLKLQILEADHLDETYSGTYGNNEIRLGEWH